MIARVNEVFISAQGEGRLAGRPTIFVRFFGCNLSCSWCDQPSALTDAAQRGVRPHFDEMDTSEIADLITVLPVQVDVCFTGGEPTQQHQAMCDVKREVEKNDNQPGAVDRVFSMETNGTIFVPGFVEYPDNAFVSCSPKFTGTVTDGQIQAFGEPQIIDWLSSDVRMQFKFVVENGKDFLTYLGWVDRVALKSKSAKPVTVILQPEWFNGREHFKQQMKQYLSYTDARLLYSFDTIEEVLFMGQMHKTIGVR